MRSLLCLRRCGSRALRPWRSSGASPRSRGCDPAWWVARFPVAPLCFARWFAGFWVLAAEIFVSCVCLLLPGAGGQRDGWCQMVADAERFRSRKTLRPPLCLVTELCAVWAWCWLCFCKCRISSPSCRNWFLNSRFATQYKTSVNIVKLKSSWGIWCLIFCSFSQKCRSLLFSSCGSVRFCSILRPITFSSQHVVEHESN